MTQNGPTSCFATSRVTGATVLSPALPSPPHPIQHSSLSLLFQGYRLPRLCPRSRFHPPPTFLITSQLDDCPTASQSPSLPTVSLAHPPPGRVQALELSSETRAQTAASDLWSVEAMGKILNFARPQFSQLQNGISPISWSWYED